jgi:hypothetical protein
MPVFGKMTLMVVTGGVALGAMLGSAADPEMKEPPAPPWRPALQPQAADNAGYQPADTWPADINVYRDSYAPSWANEELADWEPEYPAWTYSEVADQAAAAGPAIEADPAEPPQAEPVETFAPEPKLEANLDALY